ncbi:MAG: hypothetical protein GY870_20945 [archaeon]|nr:hypothetical protein [archaeon]
MSLSKRERVLKTLELDGEPDIVPINAFGFEHTGTSFQSYKNSGESDINFCRVINKTNNIKYQISEQRFWNVDIFEMDPFGPYKIRNKVRKAPPEYPDCYIHALDGTIHKTVTQIKTGLDYNWYVGGHYTTPEILHSFWDKYGKPTELVNKRIKYSRSVWEGFVEALSPYFYPMVSMPINPTEALFNGIGLGKLAYHMRKNPQFIHEVMSEYSNANIEVIKRLAEAGVDIIFFGDDLGYKEGSFFSMNSFREFILPYHKKMYSECRKHGMITVLHSCGKIDEFLPDLVDIGLNCIQSLEATAGVDLAGLKEKLGDKLCFMGGLDSSGVLTFGTPNDVAENVKKCLKAAGQGGGYIIGASHDILNIPWENLLAMRSAIEKYRHYPLNF